MRSRHTALLAVTLGLVVAAPLAAAPAPGAAALRQATVLADTWGRCPTAAPAHLALSQARSAPARVRAARARHALIAWRTVVRECSVPTPMPVAVPTA